MNINTLKQELNKKLPRISEEDLIDFVYELHRVWKNTHNKEKYGDRWKALRTFDKGKIKNERDSNKMSDVVYKFLEKRIKFGMATEIEKIVWNGKVLPKGHGQLIDARAFLQSINSNDYDTYTDYSNTHAWITDSEVLIEEDKGEL